MAGLGESCSHVAAILFYVEYAVRLRDCKTVTEKKAYWSIPGPTKGVEYSEIRDIDFSSPKAMNKHLDKKLCLQSEFNTGKQQSLKITQVLQSPSIHEMDELYAQLNASGSKPSILSIVPPYSKAYQPKSLQEELPKLLSELFDVVNLSKSYTDLLDMAQIIDMKVTPEQVAAAQKKTTKQSCSKIWFRLRAGRITASKLHAVCRTDPAQPALSLIKSICYPENNKFWSKQTDWGCKHEKQARDKYFNCVKDTHEQFRIMDARLHISTKEPHIAATPDALINCDCCGEVCLEIKCPFCIKDQFVFEGMSFPNFCLASDGQETKLKMTHPYFYQVQAQMFCTNRRYCDFFIWTEKGWYLERILFDAKFFDECIAKSRCIFFNSIMIELLGKFYSRPRATVLEACLTQNDESPRDTYCYCEGPEKGTMIACDNEHCPYEWFHMDCLKLEQAPKRKKWFCPDCSLSKQLFKSPKKKF